MLQYKFKINKKVISDNNNLDKQQLWSMMFQFVRRYGFSRVSDQLKLLNLKIPTTQQQIKTRYRQLAKMYHPDSLKQKTTKETEQLFVKVTTAYNSLKQVDQKQLTEQSADNDMKMTSEQRQKVKTKDEEMRQETYEYFRRKQFYAQKKKDPSQEKPLHKTIPQLFIGTAFVIVLFGEWIYQSTIKTKKQVVGAKKQKQTMIYENVFRSFNAHKRFSMEKQKLHQLITPEEERKLLL